MWVALARCRYVYTLFKSTGDLNVVREYFPAVLEHISNIDSQAAGGVCSMRTPYGDWCPPPAKPGQGQGEKPSKPYVCVLVCACVCACACALCVCAWLGVCVRVFISMMQCC